MRVLLVHNSYQQRGGEDEVFEAEFELLARRGVDVRDYRASNNDLEHMGQVGRSLATIWNTRHSRELRDIMREFKPDVVHVHNTFPLVSPAVFHVAKEFGAATVQTLHNYRLLCPGVNLFRDGNACLDCLHRHIKWPAVIHGCYRDDRAASMVVATMLGVHDLLGTYRRLVDVFIAPTPLAKRLHVDGGLANSKIVVKPHFLPVDPGPGVTDARRGAYALFVGRLSPEKGVDTLLAAWETLGRRLPLRVAGDGPLRDLVTQASHGNPSVTSLGPLSREAVYSQMKGATCLVFPSRCFETFGLVAIEALATGLPVVASGHGATAQLLRDGETGLLFEPGDQNDLRAKVELLLDRPELLSRMRNFARSDFLQRYTADVNFEMLMDIYRSVTP